MITNILHIFLNTALFSMPTLTNLVEHAGSSILTCLVVAGIALWCKRSSRIFLDRSEKIVLICFAAYFLVCLLFLLGHGLFNDTIPLSWELDHEIRMLAFIPIYYLFLRVGINSGALWYGLSFGAIVSGIHAIFYIYIFESGVRASGAYHSIAFGDISLVLGFMGMTGYSYFARKNKLLAIIPIAGLISALIATSLSATRGAFIALPALIIPLLFQMGHSPRPWLMRSSTIVLLAAIIISSSYLPGSLMSARIRDGIKQAVAFYNGQDSQREAVRLKMWTGAIEIFKEHPFAGVGKGGYRPAMKHLAEENRKLKDVVRYSHPHNLFLSNMADYGLSGLIILMGLFFAPLLILVPAVRGQQGPTRDLGYAGISLIAAYLIFALTESIFTRNVYISTYIILMAAILALCRNYRGVSYTEI